MRCAAKMTENREKLVCFLRQDETNTNQFTIQIKRKREICNIIQQGEPPSKSHRTDGFDLSFTRGMAKIRVLYMHFLENCIKFIEFFRERFTLLPTQRKGCRTRSVNTCEEADKNKAKDLGYLSPSIEARPV